MDPSNSRVTYSNQPSRDPDIAEEGRAWRVAFDPVRDIGNGIGADWLVECAQPDSRYGWFIVVGGHLRDVPDDQLSVPYASHEILAMALAPGCALGDVDKWSGGVGIIPPAFSHQFLARSDEQAAALVEQVVRHIVEGCSPLAGGAYWMRVVDDTAEHAYYGCHPSLN